MNKMLPYRLLDGTNRIVMCDASATKGIGLIDFTLADGKMTLAVLVKAEEMGEISFVR